jgi:AcrR family transcriptional regulator
MSKKTNRDASRQADTSTEEKIKEAARIVFTKKGYAATRTRDIAEEAGLNLALLNYYFRSKEKLFEQIMMEKIQKLFGFLMPTINEPSTSLERKLELIALNYIDMLSQTPDLPLFVLSEVRNNPERFATTIQPGKVLRESHFVKQLQEQRPDLHPIHFLMNFLGMILFPFIARPLLMSAGALNTKEFEMLMNERKSLIPKWINACLKTK